MNKSLVLFGGSFDPPHIGHIEIVRAIFAELSPDLLIVMPTGTPPHKAQNVFVPAGDRMEMAKLAFGDFDNVLVSDYEIKKSEPCFTIDTVKRLKNQYPGHDITVVIGSDEANSFDSWKDFSEILSLAKVAVFHRKGEEVNSDARFFHLSGDISAVSSTDIRVLFQSGDFDKAQEFITKEVYDYIERSGLYVLNLSEKQLVHSRNVADMSAQLARVYGADEQLAFKAGLYHDIAKEQDFEKMLQNVGKWVLTSGKSRDIIQTVEYWRDFPTVIHAFAGAEEVYAKYFHLVDNSDDVIDAIRYHTSGCAEMSLLQKIVFIADAVEVGRRYDGADEMRQVAFTDIDKAVALVLKRTLSRLRKYNIKIFPLT
jgi:nicotinate (nicotinamide) nucleotide adenylyltransferase